MKMQRRTGRPSDMTGRPISGNGHDNGTGDGISNGNGAENGAYTDANNQDTLNGSDYAEGSNGAEAAEPRAELNAESDVDVVEIPSFTNGSNGSNGAHKAETSTPTLPKRRRRIVSSATEVMARPAPERAEVATSAAAVAMPAPKPISAPWRLYLTYEKVFWLAVFAIAIFSRFWDLGSRGIHHDESLHAHFSDVLYTGGGYVHDPMMHGPLQFHAIGFMYWLFGASDATARFASVFSGIWVVMSPFFLRKQMGRVPAMVCAFLLLISPSILYFSRMAREDAIFSGMEMIMLVGLWRFVSMRKPADFMLFSAGLALMFTIKETSFLTLAIVGVFFLALFAYQAGYAILAALGGYIVAAGGLFVYINSGMKAGTIAGLPTIANPGPDTNIIMTFAMKFVTHPMFYGQVLLFILFIAGVTLLLNVQRGALSTSPISNAMPQRMRLRSSMATAGAGAGVGSGGEIPRRAARPSSTTSNASPANGHETPEVREVVTPIVQETATDDVQYAAVGDSSDAQEIWEPNRLDPKPGSLFARYQPGSIPHLLGALFSRPKVIVISLLIASAIFFTLYTVFFTDIPHGLVSGIFASLGYWMGQHDVARGGQPWFYYFLLIPIYEPIAVFFSLAGTFFFGWRGVRWLLRRRRGEDGDNSANVRQLGMFNTDRAVPFASFKAFLPLFLVWWLIGTMGIYSWAGEKMPWLMMHMVRPAIFLASLFVGALLLSLMRRRSERLAAAGVDAPDMVIASVPVATGASGANGVPARRRTGSGARVAQPVIARVQDPPWVAWSKPGSHFPIAAFLATFVILVMAWGLLINALTSKAKGDPSIFTDKGPWGWTWIYPLIIIVMVVGYAVWVGAGRSLRYLGLGILTIGLMYQFRSAVNLAYNQPDVSTELASYVQTSPDVTRVMGEIKTYANYATTGKDLKGGKDIKIMYDSFTSWPMEWYLRDYNKIFVPGTVQPGSDVPILLLEYNKYKDNLNFLPNYIPQRYAMRWWFPQEWYMDEFLPNQYVKDDKGNRITDPVTGKPKMEGPLGQVGDALNTIKVTVTEPRFEATLWKYLIFRETPKPLGSEDMVLYLRRDIAQQFHRLQYDPPASTDVP